MSVVNGQNADASTFNSAFASKSQNNTLQGVQTLAHPGSGSTVADTQQAINDVIASDALKIPLAQKGVASGVATLDASTLVPVAQVPDLTASKITDFNTSADARITLQKGAVNGIAPLDASSKIDSSYLPSYVDDVVEVANYASLPGTGETGKIYVTLDTNKTYRWSGSVYVQIGQPIASTSDVPEGTNLYFTSARVADKQIGIQFQDQGSNLGTTATVDTIDFIGAGITATRATNKVTVSVTATGGGGSKNYFSQSNINPDFESGVVTPWSVNKFTWDAIKNTPSGYGAPVNGSLAVSASNPLAGTRSLIYSLVANSSPNSKYEGFTSASFFVDREDCGKVLFGSFHYELVSGTVDFSGSSTQSLEIWIYNFVKNEWIQPAGWRGMNQTLGSGKVVFSFQTDSDPTYNEYVLAVLTQQPSTNAYSVKFDDFSVGPQAIVLGTAITDWQSYTPTFTGFGTPSPSSVEFQWRRVGSDIEVRGKFTSGTTTNTEARISLPSGVTASDTTRIPSIQSVGSYFRNQAGGATIYHGGSMFIEPSVTYLTLSGNGVFSNSSINPLSKINGTDFVANDQISFTAKLPVAGWSSSSQVSSDTDTRVVACSVRSTVILSTTAGVTVKPQTLDFDTHGAYSLANGLYTCPVSGIFKISISDFEYNLASPASSTEIKVYKNGSPIKTLDIMNNTASAQNGSSIVCANYMIQCNAGDTLGIVVEGGVGLYGGGTRGACIQYQRLSGPSVVTATESVSARYNATAGQTIGTTDTIINFANKTFDSHSAVTTGASWKYVAPISGKYLVSGFVTISSGSIRFVYLYVNGTNVGTLGNGSGSGWEIPLCAQEVNLNAGDYIDIRAKVSPSASMTTTATDNYINIIRVGN